MNARAHHHLPRSTTSPHRSQLVLGLRETDLFARLQRNWVTWFYELHPGNVRPGNAGPFNIVA